MRYIVLFLYTICRVVGCRTGACERCSTILWCVEPSVVFLSLANQQTTDQHTHAVADAKGEERVAEVPGVKHAETISASETTGQAEGRVQAHNPCSGLSGRSDGHV